MSKIETINKTIQALQEAILETKDPAKKIELTDRLLHLLKHIPPEKTLWNDQDVMNFLKLTNPNTLAKMRSCRRIPFIKSKTIIRYDPDSIIQWAKNQEIKMNPVWRKRR